MGLALQIIIFLIGGMGTLSGVFAMDRSWWRTAIIGFSIFLLVIGLGLTVLTFADPPTADEIATKVAVLLRRIPGPFNRLRDETLPGFGAGIAVDTTDLTEDRKKFQYSFRTPEGAKAVFYLSPSNHFAFSVTDIHGEVYTLEIPLGASGVPFESWAYIFCEVGSATDYAYMRAIANGIEVARRDYPFPLDFGSRKWMPTLGADSDGNNGGAFFFAEMGAYSTTLSDATLSKLTDNVLQHYGIKKEAPLK
jgi:hypothetical protein